MLNSFFQSFNCSRILVTCHNGTFGQNCNGTCRYCINYDDCKHVNGTCINGCHPCHKENICKSRM